ncbi:MAG: C-terminal binding protein [Gammaproteobacteria bacterium]|nr:C-terminal binding protein [Gammaproteobacteria bacterium]
MADRNYTVMVQAQAGSTAEGTERRYALEREALDPIGAEIVEVPAGSDEEFIEAVKDDADALIARGRFLNRDIISSLNKCVVVGLGSVGADTVDVDAATDHDIVVTNVPDVFIDEVADHTMMLLLAAHRRLLLMHQMTRDGRWREGRPYHDDIPRMWGCTIGLISFGNVARAVARRCHVFGLRVIAYDPFVGELEMTKANVEPVTSLFELLERSDFVSMHAPLNAQTHHMLSDEHFARMKTSALFINNGRGKTVDEEALIRALESKAIAGAALDVFEQEPVSTNNPLLHMDNVACTPHMASASARMGPESRRRLGRELAMVLQGRWPRSAVNPSVLSRTNLRRWQPLS